MIHSRDRSDLAKNFFLCVCMVMSATLLGDLVAPNGEVLISGRYEVKRLSRYSVIGEVR